jgi:hypothetical protein
MPNNQVAYGFQSLADVMSKRAAEVGAPVINKAITDTLSEYNRVTDGLMSLLVEKTTEAKATYALPGSGTLQPLDEWGNPLPVKGAGTYDVAWPIQGGGTAWGNNRVSRAMSTVADENDNMMEAMRKDADWMRRHAMAALFSNAAYNFNDAKLGTLSIVPLANGDAQKYVIGGGSSVTDTHFYAQSAAIADGANPFPAIKTELTEHLGNGTRLVVFLPTNLVTSVTGLTEFVDVNNPDVISGSGDTLRSDGSQFRFMGDEVLGHLKGSRIWVTEWRGLPDNYGFALAVDAPKALKMREYPAAALQGLFPEFHSEDGNTQVKRMIRYAGFGVNNRVAAVPFLIGSATYTPPTALTAPLGI